VWCAACGWNIEPLRPRAAESWSQAMRLRAGRWMGASVLGEVSHETRRRPSVYAVAAYAYALLAYLLLAALAIGGIALVVLGFPNPFLIVVGVVALGIAWVVRPRMPPVPDGILDRTDFEGLYEVADRVSDALGARRVDGIVVDDQFNASFGRYGRRGRRIMRLGLPLFSVLEPQERVALVAHEIAHDVNGDPARGIFIGGAFNVLVELHGFFQPQHLGPALDDARVAQRRQAGLVSVSARLANVILAGISYVVRPFVMLFGALLWRDTQRAEYRADALAADIAGTAAAGCLLRKAHLAGTFANFSRSAAARREHADVLGDLRRWVVNAPPSEWERIDRIMALQSTQVDATHPPSHERRAYLQRRGDVQPRVTMTSAERDAIDRELMPLETTFTHDLIDAACDRLYRH
jgi:Zn-dependent protease with chaperone function